MLLAFVDWRLVNKIEHVLILCVRSFRHIEAPHHGFWPFLQRQTTYVTS